MVSDEQPRRRPNHAVRTQVLVMLSILALVWAATGLVLWRSSNKPQIPQRFLGELRRLKNAKPQADAAARLEAGDHRLLVLERGEGQTIPGVAVPDARMKYGVRVVPYLFDATASKDQEELQHAAFEYAYNYNLFVIKKLAATLPTTAGAATTPATVPTSGLVPH